MADNKSKVKEDRRRVALEQQHEREYALKKVDAIGSMLLDALSEIETLYARLRSGFPSSTATTTKASKRRGK